MMARDRYAKPAFVEPLMLELARFIPAEKQLRRISTQEMAQRLGRRPRNLSSDLGAIQRGDLSRFSAFYLLRMVEALGYDVHVTFTPRKAVTAVPERMAA